MSGPSNTSAALLAALKAESAALGDTIRVASERKTQVDALIRSYEPAQTVEQPAVPPSSSTRGPFFGMTLPEAAAKQLSLAGAPQLPREILAALEATGFPINSENKAHAVHWALRRRSRTIGDVVLVGRGRWDLKERYSDADLLRIAEAIGGMGGRDRDQHIEKTKVGIANLKANGVRWGRPFVITAETMEVFVRLRESGKSLKDCAEGAGFSLASYYGYSKQYNMKDWRPGDPWPPPERKSKGAASDADSQTETGALARPGS